MNNNNNSNNNNNANSNTDTSVQGSQDGASSFANLVPNRNYTMPPPRNGPSLTETTTADITGPHGDARGGRANHNDQPTQIRYGEADLRPAGSVPFGDEGGMLVGPNHPRIQEMLRGGMQGGPGLQDPAQQYARYYPVAPGDAPRGRGSGPAGFAYGEPDPDHLPPFDPRNMGAGRGGMRGGRGGFPPGAGRSGLFD